MIYKCKKCKYTTEDLSRQVCPLCGNKIVQKQKNLLMVSVMFMGSKLI